MSCKRPLWLDFPRAHVRAALDGLTASELAGGSLTVPRRWPKPRAVEFVTTYFFDTVKGLPSHLSDLGIRELLGRQLGQKVIERIVYPPCPAQADRLPPSGFIFRRPGPRVTKNRIKTCLNSLHPDRRVPLGDLSFDQLSEKLYESVLERACMLMKLPFDVVLAHIHCLRPAYSPISAASLEDLVLYFLKQEYDSELIDSVVRLERPTPAADRCPHKSSVEDEKEWWRRQDAAWPHTPDIMRCIGMMKTYHEASKIKYGPVCAVCSRKKLEQQLIVSQVAIFSDDERTLYENLAVLRCTDTRFDPDFVFKGRWAPLSGLMLDENGMDHGEKAQGLLSICVKCRSYLDKGKVPPHAWANGLYRGKLAIRFNEFTWVEEKACAAVATLAHVVRLYNSTREDAPKVFYGNVCAHDANVVDFATALPRTPQDINDCITVVFVGPERYKAECIKKLFYVRKGLMLDFLHYMKYVTKHPDYVNIPISEENLALYPDCDALPGSLEKVIHDQKTDPSAFQQETAGPDSHPAEGLQSTEDDEPIIFMEKVGISDPDAQMGSAEVSTAYGLRNMYAKKGVSPDLVIQRSQYAVPEYHNPNLFPAQFPTLFPYGTGGFEDRTRLTPISFQEQANLFLDTVDRSCRYHHCFIFVVCNILQRRAGHLGTYITVGEERFDEVANRLVKLDEKVVLSVADRMEHGIKLENLNEKEQAVMELLKEVRTVAARVPGSFAGKLRARTEIRNYMAFFNLPMFFFTANPNAMHSPLFQVMYGDETVNLDERFPSVAAYNERARRVARDPVAAADFFDVSFRLILEYLLGWDFEHKRSKKEGGILGHVSGWVEMSELTGRGGIHGHTIVCVRGSLNPTELHARMREDAAFAQRVCDYFDSIQWHHTPDVAERDSIHHDVRCERVVPPPRLPMDLPLGNLQFEDCFEQPSAFCARLEVAGFGDVAQWWMDFLRDVKTCAEKLQRHTCRDVCFKYDHDTCRFRFPHDLVSESHFDSDTNSLWLRVRDPLVNWFNAFLLAATRHNHDIRTMLSGSASRAVMYYVTDYITKMEEKTHYIVSLFSHAVSAAKNASADKPNAGTPAFAKTLIHKCLAQLTSRQQIHAQQAAWYVRGHGDAMMSHKTVPMLSGSLIRLVRQLYGGAVSVSTATIEDDSDNEDLAEVTDPCESEETQIRLVVDSENNVVEASNQVQNYYYRDTALKDICFYDFVHRFCLEKNTTTPEKKGAYRRFALLHPHRLKDTHQIVEHTNYDTHANPVPRVPVVYGSSIPRSTGDRLQYCVFVLAHFKPFSPQQPLIQFGEQWETVFESYSFCELGQRVIRNWEALYECEDEREQERQRKRDNRLQTTRAMRSVVEEQANLLIVDEMATGKQSNGSFLAEFLIGKTGRLLCSSGWFGREVAHYRFGRSDSAPLPIAGNRDPNPDLEVTQARLTWWTKALKEQEKEFISGGSAALSVKVQDSRVYRPPTTPSASRQLGCVTPVCTEPSLVSESPREIIARIGKAAGLNREQYMVYEIAANAYIELLEERKAGVEKKDESRLSMFVNGPGGTGKTYAIQTFQELMSEFRCGHRIKYTAPSGAAASLIHGVTLHSGLKIRVFKGKERHGQYAITLTAQQKLELQSQFQEIDVLVVDEVSMVSAALMAQIDASTRIAKNNDQPFGGLITIFSGDFYQFEPVAAFSLYKTIDQITRKKGPADYKLQSKLGRMAWKTVNTVVELFRQERMKDDPLFGNLVLRLRRGECTADDIDLLNTRVIKSHMNPLGIQIDADADLKAAVVVVRKNEDRVMANYCKAIETCPNLVMCAARDYIDDVPVKSPLLRSYLLKLDMTKDMGQGALPPYVPLFCGMPIIMRRHNQAACLGIANGAQGFLRHFEVDVDEHGYTYLKSSIVEFPDSRVKLPGLPAKHVALPTWKHSFRTVVPGALIGETEGRVVTVVRHLTDFDPAFAITAHCAQGKTMKKVVGHLKNGGPPAYVTVSRARSLKDLVLLSPVSQSTLNQALDEDLLLETARLDALHHNTLIRYGYKKGNLVDVVDPDASDESSNVQNTVRYTWKERVQRKTKASDDIPIETDCVDSKGEASGAAAEHKALEHGDLPTETDDHFTRTSRNKRALSNVVDNGISAKRKRVTPRLWGCRWDETNWSCSYDCLVVVVHSLLDYTNANVLCRLGTVCHPMQSLLDIFFELRPESQAALEQVRQRARVVINSWDCTAFPLHGEALVSFERLMYILTDQDSLTMRVSVFSICNACRTQKILGSNDFRSPSIVCRQLLRSLTSQSSPLHSIQDWMNAATTNEGLRVIDGMTSLSECQCAAPVSVSTFVNELKPVLYFELQDRGIDVNSTRSLSWSLRTHDGVTAYTLHAIIYLGGYHFTCRVFWNENWWYYDGQSPEGLPCLTTEPVDLNTDPQGRCAHILIYCVS